LKVFSSKEVEAEKAEGEKAKIRWLITEATGAENFAMRLIEIEPGGSSPHHSHEWEHEVFVLEGNGAVKGGNEEKTLRKGTVVLVPKNEIHQFINIGKKTLKFICLVPLKKKIPQKKAFFFE
jgi:quercetin dioxygenase-like cupin family protein